MVLNLYTHQDTQKTYRRIVSEHIRLYGIPIRYVPKVVVDESLYGEDPNGSIDDEIHSNNGLNNIYGEDSTMTFKDAIPMKGMLEQFDFYEGTHNMFSKFNFSMEDEITLSFEIENWRNLLEEYGYELQKPLEGDLIIFDLAVAKNGKPQIFEIKNVNESASYFQFGTLFIFRVNCKVWDYGHETMETGDELLDSLNNIDAVTGIGDNKEIEDKAKTVTSWNPNDPFGEN